MRYKIREINHFTAIYLNLFIPRSLLLKYFSHEHILISFMHSKISFINFTRVSVTTTVFERKRPTAREIRYCQNKQILGKEKVAKANLHKVEMCYLLGEDKIRETRMFHKELVDRIHIVCKLHRK